MNKELKRRPDEVLDEAYIWRIGTAKESGLIDATWAELAPIISEECCEDKAEACWRKHYAAGKRWKAFFDTQNLSEDEQRLRESKQEITKERMKLRDERTALNKELRNHARYEVNNEMWEAKLAAIGRQNFPIVDYDGKETGRALLICLSDWHIGMDFDTYTGKYNTEIAKQRLSRFLYNIRDIKRRHEANTAYVVLLGDMISGTPHSVIALENRENVIEQVMTASELLSSFIYQLSQEFARVNVTSVVGNHSRITQNKKDALVGERLDALITWHVRSELKHLPNVTMYDVMSASEGTFDIVDIYGRTYAILHGDYDKFTENGVAKLIAYLGFVPYAVVMAHKHNPAFMVANGITCIQSGCLSGSGDQFTLEHRMRGQASQTVCVCTEDGVEAMYPVRLA